MKKTGNVVIDTILSNFRTQVRGQIARKNGVSLETCLDCAINGAVQDLRYRGFKEPDVRNEFLANEDEVRQTCRKIIVELEKRKNLADIRQASITAILDDFIAKNSMAITYKMRDNNTVGFSVQIPSSKQRVHFSLSYTKVLSREWMEGLERDINDLVNISARLGRIKILN